MATSLVVKCVCLSEEPQGIRPGPNAQTRLESDSKCPHCGGEGVLVVKTSFDPPPIPITYQRLQRVGRRLREREYGHWLRWKC